MRPFGNFFASFMILIIFGYLGSSGILGQTEASAKESITYWSLLTEFKKGNYSYVANRSRQEIIAQTCDAIDERFILIYISSASDLKEMDSTLETCYSDKKVKNAIFYNAIYLVLERLIVAGNDSNAEKWGFRFRKDGTTSSRYAEGLYLYAIYFYQNQRWRDSLFVLQLAEQANPQQSLVSRIQKLKTTLTSKISGATP
ncbi:hypothetical protein [Leptospira sp. GIMC2001]|uniref:hypothetical protein n=1 Tax=Leptospira sp. GIMC2001 TaxID=1513297 RepID=UPI00234B5960|nr:hypothetical protein [Leptospira sp. GIMC2001]WCL49135.1 hypothetical protein O4O04_17865 [Leptospira sp. GIMC2001]